MLAKLLASLCVAGGACCVALALCGQPPADAATKSHEEQSAVGADGDDHRVPLVVARERAELMHRIYQATLHVMHERYFHDVRAMVPARALEDVFAEMARQSQVEAKWISVNTRAMSLNHEPQSEFEKAAAKEIAAGKEEYELVENGYYRRVGAIPLASGCVNCHTGFFNAPHKTPRFAGLVISVPVKEE